MSTITEDDLRMPEFRGVKLTDLERRDDGAIVRKDRWEQGIQAIRNSIPKLAGLRDGWEVEDVVKSAQRAIKAEAALASVYRALCAEQMRQQALSRELRDAGAVPDLSAKHRREGITAPIRLLTDAAGENGYVLT